MENQLSYANKTDDMADEVLVHSRKNISPYYNMNNKYRGFGLIFNHEHFDAEPDDDENVALKERTGTSVDCERLKKCLESLDFKVYVFQDLTKLNVYKMLKKFSQKDHSQNDCFLVAVLTHGDKGRLYARDGSYKCEDLWSPFYKSHCPSLEGKPKIFIVQACQGKLFDHGVILDCNVDISDNHIINNSSLYVNPSSYIVDKPFPEDYYFPHQPVKEFDFLTVFSSPPDHFSWRNRVYGSWFIQELCAEFEENPYNKNEHLLHMLTNVFRCVAIKYQSNVPDDERLNEKKQIPYFNNTFLKICQFKEKKRNSFGVQFKRSHK